MERMFTRRARKVGTVLCAGALAFSMTVGTAAPAFAASSTPAMETGKNVTASPTPFTSSLPEFLGIDTVDERWGLDRTENGAVGITDSFNDNASGALRYILMGSSKYNINPDPYMYNTIYDTSGEQVIQNSKRAANSSATNMNRALGMPGEATADDAIWSMKPDIILGVVDNSGNKITSYSDAAAALKQTDSTKYDGYAPVGVDVSGTVVDILYDMAAKADKIVADSNGKKTLRYGNATDLAKNYESIIVGAQGYLLSQMNLKGIEKRSVAFVTKNEDGNVTLSSSFAGAAACLTNVANNVAESLVSGDETAVTVPIAKLKEINPDLIVIQTNDDTRNNVKPTGMEAYYDKMYWTSDSDCGTIGSDKQGPDLAQNYGRLYGCLYPEIFDQSDWVAYYYDTVYHIKPGELGAAIDKAMDGVRNWDVKSGSNADAYLRWSAGDVADYSRAEVKSMIDYGVAYLKANPVSAIDVTDALKATAGDYAAMDNPGAVSLDNATVTLSQTSYVATGSAITPSVTVTLDGKTLAKDTDFTVSYANNTNVGTATVTVTGKGAYKGTKTATFTINAKVISLANAKVKLEKTSYAATGSAIKPGVTVTLDGKTLKNGTDYTVTYTNNTKVGTATATIKGKGTYSGTKKATFKINAVSLSSAKVTLEKTSYLALGSAVTPAATVKVGSKTLKKGTDYTVSYANNTKAGTATVTVTGKGIYTGTKKATFKINAVTPANAPAVTGTWKKSGNRWMFTLDSKSKKALGTSKSNLPSMWLKIGGKKYHFDSTGKMHTGWQKVSGKWYYLKSDGAMATGWQKVSGKWYYLKSDGAMATGWQKVSGKWYYLKSSGAMTTGWQKISGKWYYLKSSGAMTTGWQKIGGTWYNLGTDGKMLTGKKTLSDKKTYFFTSSGAMKTGWNKEGSNWYYYGSSGAMLKNTTIGGYRLGADGKMVTK